MGVRKPLKNDPRKLAMNLILSRVKREQYLEYLQDGEPCDHIGCLHHVSHPCESCGRVAGRRPTPNALDGAICSCPHEDNWDCQYNEDGACLKTPRK